MLMSILNVIVVLAGVVLGGGDHSASACQVIHEETKGQFVHTQWGSGVVVDNGGGRSLILTNAHVAPSAVGKYRVVCNGDEYVAAWVRADAAVDLALLSVPAVLAKAELAVRGAAVGDRVRMFAYTDGGAQRLKSGVVTEHASIPRAVLVSSMPSDHGDSGAGVLDNSGRLVAINFAKRNADGFSFATPVGDVRKFLDPGAAQPQPLTQKPVRVEWWLIGGRWTQVWIRDQ